jgi:DNA-binding NtrC family response regulator
MNVFPPTMKSQQSHSRKKVLLVEDNETFRPILQSLVQHIDAGLQVIVADSVQSALQAIEEHSALGRKIDLIISDISYGTIHSGLAIWEAAQKFLPLSEFLLISESSLDDLLAAFDNEDNPPNYLPKPFRSDQCRDMVKWLLNAQKPNSNAA